MAKQCSAGSSFKPFLFPWRGQHIEASSVFMSQGLDEGACTTWVLKKGKGRVASVSFTVGRRNHLLVQQLWPSALPLAVLPIKPCPIREGFPTDFFLLTLKGMKNTFLLVKSLVFSVLCIFDSFPTEINWGIFIGFKETGSGCIERCVADRGNVEQFRREGYVYFPYVGPFKCWLNRLVQSITSKYHYPCRYTGPAIPWSCSGSGMEATYDIPSWFRESSVGWLNQDLDRFVLGNGLNVLQ